MFKITIPNTNQIFGIEHLIKGKAILEVLFVILCNSNGQIDNNRIDNMDTSGRLFDSI